ncbi:AAA family ATPase [Bdellovibrio bacteriovorus]|uniref:AAA domain-containing protein n=1 Tax=Bdellovibrio bacteriovorus TaxID=959 RepID=A0A1Z3N5P4_BDEBC|nr:DUF3696 domain-containing protein [Bdellovibrio bacteriovorus]ASD62810.1 hypothetical protein B9G79_04130 [Bdellovibrio bacteriovorus]
MEGRYPDRIDSEAANLVAFLLRHTRTNSERLRLNSVITKWLGERLELIDNTKLEKMKGISAHILKGTDPTLRTSVALANTGYGVSQVLPIIVAKAFSNKGAILIEQPELHLHPKAQAEIAELLLEMAEEGHQLFIETHSEHLILRLRSLVAQKKSPLPPDEIKLFHVNKKKDGSTLDEVSITETGDLEGWPEGFFSASSEDISAILRAKMSVKK